MARKKQDEPPKNDFAYKEDLDICSFSSAPIIAGDRISSFSFDDDIILENISLADSNNDISLSLTDTSSNISSKNIIKSANNTDISKKNILSDNRKVPVVNGMAPPINGEFLDVKRTYMLRASTVRKINELKSIHPDLNAYVSTIVDFAISHYYNHIVNEGGTQ